MAIEFKNAIKESVGNAWTNIYTAPVDGAYFIQLDISCVGNTGVQVSVRIGDTSAAITAFLAKEVPVPIGSSIQVIDGQKIVLESSDTLEVKCDTAGEVVDVIGSLVENVNS